MQAVGKAQKKLRNSGATVLGFLQAGDIIVALNPAVNLPCAELTNSEKLLSCNPSLSAAAQAGQPGESAIKRWLIVIGRASIGRPAAFRSQVSPASASPVGKDNNARR